MSKNSSKTQYEASQEWLKWAKGKYQSLRRKKSKPLYQVESK